jgi:hypothetical protein
MEKRKAEAEAAGVGSEVKVAAPLNLFIDQDQILFSTPDHLKSKVVDKSDPPVAPSKLGNLEEVSLPTEFVFKEPSGGSLSYSNV